MSKKDKILIIKLRDDILDVISAGSILDVGQWQLLRHMIITLNLIW